MNICRLCVFDELQLWLTYGTYVKMWRPAVTSYRFMPANKRSGVPQADELVRAARVTVFLLDEYQGVRPYGSER